MYMPPQLEKNKKVQYISIQLSILMQTHIYLCLSLRDWLGASYPYSNVALLARKRARLFFGSGKVFTQGRSSVLSQNSTSWVYM